MSTLRIALQKLYTALVRWLTSMPKPPQPPQPPQETMQAMVLRVVVEEGLTPQMQHRVFKTIMCESEFDPSATHQNKNGTTDYGICQFNDGKGKDGAIYWIGTGACFPSPEYVLKNPEACVRVMCREFKLGHQGYWECYKKLYPKG